MEVKCFELRDKLEEAAEVDEEEIDKQVDELRKKLLEEMERGGGADSARLKGRGLKSHQVHELAEAKQREMKRMEKAFGISPDYEEVCYMPLIVLLKLTANLNRRGVIGKNKPSGKLTENTAIHQRTEDFSENSSPY